MNLNRRHKRRGGALWLALLFLTFFGGLSAAAQTSLPEPTGDYYVADYAGVLSEETKADILEENDALCRETGAQIVVVTVDTLDGTDIAAYTYNLFSAWGIGSAEKNNGFLLVLAIEEDDYYALQGVGLASRISDSAVSDLLYQYLEPDFSKKAYDTGVKNVFQAVLARIRSVEGAASVSESTVTENYSGIAGATASQKESSGSGFFQIVGNFFGKGFLLIFLILIFGVIILFSIFRGPRRHYWGGYGRRFWYPRRPPPMGGFGAPGFGPPPPGRPARRPGTPNRRPPSSGGFGGGRPSGGFGAGRSSGVGRSGGGGRSAGGGAGRRR